MASTIRFYTDEMVSSALVEGLRRRGIDVLSTPDAGMLSKKDEEHLAFAIAQHRTLFTLDDDFLRLAAITPNHSGIVYAAQDKPLSKILKRLINLWEHSEPAEVANQVIYV